MDDLKQFDIIFVDLPKMKGSIQSGKRPAIVMQNNTGNAYSPNVIIIPLTKHIKKASQPTHCVIHKSEETGLFVDSMALGEGIVTLSKENILYKMGSIVDEKEQSEVIAIYIRNVLLQNNDVDPNANKIRAMMLNILGGVNGNEGRIKKGIA